MGTFTRAVLLLPLMVVLAFCQSPPVKDIYAAGISYNSAGTPSIAGTGLAAHLVKEEGTYLFAAFDSLPSSIKPFIVTNQVSGGVAQKVVTIGGVPIYVPISAGFSWSGTNSGWAWTTGALASIHIKGNWYFYPALRTVKSSISNGQGYPLIATGMFGYGK